MKDFIRTSLMAAALAGLVSLGAAAQSTDKSSDQSSSQACTKGFSQLSPADQNFAKKAAEGGLAEVELGKLATEKASSDDVKKFGQRMVDDHSKANDQLKLLASQKGINLPSDLNPKDKALSRIASRCSTAQSSIALT